ncbi:MAG: hypothetical protein E3J72_17855 [Planctomycetota bacterium]|nr:MAG: hypothetical protein E3J72_17855 [Planctomycetota bacterium]
MQFNELNPESYSLKDELISTGIDNSDASWLARVIEIYFNDDAETVEDNAETLDIAARILGNIYQQYNDRNGALVEILGVLLGRIYPDGSFPFYGVQQPDTQNQILDFWFKENRNIDYTHGIRLVDQQKRNDKVSDVQEFVRIIYERNNSLINLTGLLDSEYIENCYDKQSLSFSYADPTKLPFWIRVVGRKWLFDRLKPTFHEKPIEQLGQYAIGLYKILKHTEAVPEVHQEASHDLRKQTKDQIGKFQSELFTTLDSRITDEPKEMHEKAWFLYAIKKVQFDNSPLSVETKQRLIKSARNYLGKARKTLRSADASFDSEMLQWSSELIARIDSLWKAEELLLKCLRSLGTPSVASDLRYWSEFGLDEIPAPWFIIPDRFAAFFHTFTAGFDKDDKRLIQFRMDFSAFLISRLKSRKKKNKSESKNAHIDEDFIEQDPIWRFYIVRALRELKINPWGKGHNVLHWLSKSDPNNDVRNAAKTAYKEMRHKVSLPPGKSQRRAVLAAFLWLRRAHFESLGFETDERGAQRTLAKELRFSQRKTSKEV